MEHVAWTGFTKLFLANGSVLHAIVETHKRGRWSKQFKAGCGAKGKPWGSWFVDPVKTVENNSRFNLTICPDCAKLFGTDKVKF